MPLIGLLIDSIDSLAIRCLLRCWRAGVTPIVVPIVPIGAPGAFHTLHTCPVKTGEACSSTPTQRRIERRIGGA